MNFLQYKVPPLSYYEPMNKELYHKIIMLGCLFLLITSSIGTNNDPLLPEDYAKIVQEHFANEEWEEGKTLLEEGLGRYPKVSDLQWLMGKYWHHKKDYDQARYHLIKAIEDNYNNVNAKQLLVDVEENTQNYSSAICYVNELLEVNPYWRGLWRRKIDLYRKQGNDVEADRLLKRINQIYPNDTILRKDYIYSMELGYQHMKKGGNRKEAINTLTELIKAAPGNEQYYLDIINLQLQEGNQEAALGWASNGLSEIPGSYSLISKKVGILGELARYPEALVFMRDQMRKNNSAALRQLYNHILLEAAQAERQRDPYVLYGIVYDNGKNNKEALDYLLNTSVTRGYSDDAFYYLREAKKKYGDTDKGILYKEYLLYRKMNEKDRAFSTLNKLYELYPDDYDILLAICEQHMEKAERLIELGLHAEALPHTQFIIQKQVDSEITGIAWERALGCYISMKKYNEALAALDTLTTRYPEYENGIWKRAFILDKMDKTAEALDIYLSAIEHSGEDMRMFYVIGYEELAIPYIKKCMEAGNTQRAHDTACKLVQLNPSSDLGLRYAINTSADNYPLFYAEIVHKNIADRHDFVLTPLPAPESDFTLVCIADPQCATTAEISRYVNETIPDVEATVDAYKAKGTPVYGITLGDIVFDTPDLWSNMKESMANRNLPVFQTIGNHDHLQTETSDDNAAANFETQFGPRNYSFNRGDVHIVSMDNVLYEGKKKYKGGITDRQLEWLRQDLSHVDKDKLVIFCAHIPFRGGTSVTDESHENYDGVLDLLSGFSEAHIMIGHTHYHQKYIHKRNGKTILEHVHGAACGAWWTANICADGTPNGYSVYEISGNTIANQYYKSTNKEADYQIRAYSATQVFGKSGSLTFGWAANAPAMNDAKCIVANVWNSDASGNWKVSLWQNGTKVCDMTRVKTYDYWAYAYHVLYYSKSVGTTWGKNPDHYYSGNLSSGTPGAADFEIVAEDGMGNTYRTSKLQTDFTGF